VGLIVFYFPLLGLVNVCFGLSATLTLFFVTMSRMAVQVVVARISADKSPDGFFEAANYLKQRPA
jgi:hypothetical protein